MLGKNRTKINKNDNLNNYLEVGYYQSANTSTSETLANCPVTMSFNLDIISTTGHSKVVAGTYGYIIQIIECIDGTKWFRKITSNASGTISYDSWKKDIDSTDIVNNLTSTSTTKSLSAYQGKVLGDKLKHTNIEYTVVENDNYTIEVEQTVITHYGFVIANIQVKCITPVNTWVNILKNLPRVYNTITGDAVGFATNASPLRYRLNSTNLDVTAGTANTSYRFFVIAPLGE